MSINSIYPTGTTIRFSGMASGLDTESIIKDLMRIEQMKVDKLKQNRQLIEWQRDAYREIIKLLRGLKDQFFDVLNPDHYMLSASGYKTFSVTSSHDQYITATANADALVGTYVIDSIDSLAREARMEGADNITSLRLIATAHDGQYMLEGQQLTLTVDGVKKTITFAKNYDSLEGNDGLVADFQRLIDDAFGEGKVNLSLTDQTIILNAPTSTVTIAPLDDQDISQVLDIAPDSSSSNRLSLSTKLGDMKLTTPLVFEEGEIKFTINGREFSFSTDDTLRDVINQINADQKAGVTLVYSSLTGTFTLQTKDTGSTAKIEIQDVAGNFLSAIGMDTSQTAKGQDAVITINNQKVYRSSNTFTIDGITYNLKAETDQPVELKVERDIDTAVNNIKAFVDKYNEFIAKINNVLREKRDPSYLPLTDEQRKEMSERDIELWEEKAKKGLLRSDPLLENILYGMRRALIEKVEGVDISLWEIGITTGQWYENGKLYVDENKLRTALLERGDEVTRLFSQSSDISYSPDLSSQDRKIRYSGSGLMHRISDILQDNIRTIRDSSGKKGILLEKAGIEGDLSEVENMMNEQLKRMDRQIERTLELLVQKEERYWRQFTAMERAMQQMYAQSDWLYYQFNMWG
ncbi:MAG TPA: flagellar filament capping protein FliD [Clostridiales bacterium]|nr:flagellar filament capping protein FliD [Clostridiales bacterium]